MSPFSGFDSNDAGSRISKEQMTQYYMRPGDSLIPDPQDGFSIKSQDGTTNVVSTTNKPIAAFTPDGDTVYFPTKAEPRNLPQETMRNKVDMG